MPLNGSLSASIDFTLKSTANTAESEVRKFADTDAPAVNFNEGGTNDTNKAWSAVLTLAASTPQTLDLRALPGPYGSTIVLAKAHLVWVRILTGTISVRVGGAATQAWEPFWSAAGNTEEVPLGTPWFKTKPAGFVVDATHRNLKVDPGAAPATVLVVIAGHT